MIFLCLRFVFFYSSQKPYTDGQALFFETTLLSEPTVFGNTQRFSIKPDQKQQITITTTRFPELHYGDHISVSGSVKKRLLQGKREIFVMQYPTISYISNQKSFDLLSIPINFASIIRQKTIEIFDQTLSQTESHLLLGIVFGIKLALPKTFNQNLQTSGVYHVITASGMNVVMLSGFVSSLFLLFLKRQHALILTVLLMLFYALLSGLSPSIVRASIMAAIAILAQIIGRQYKASYIVFLTGALMLLFDPGLLQDIGFQLSFLSTLGLIFIRPMFFVSSTAKKLIEKSIIGEEVLTTVSAQLATPPILLANFGTYSLSSVLINGLVLWTVPILMFFGGIAALIGLLLPFVAKLLLFLSAPLLWYFEKIVTDFPKVGSLSLDSFPWQMGIGYYLILIAIVIATSNPSVKLRVNKQHETSKKQQKI